MIRCVIRLVLWMLIGPMAFEPMDFEALDALIAEENERFCNVDS